MGKSTINCFCVYIILFSMFYNLTLYDMIQECKCLLFMFIHFFAVVCNCIFCCKYDIEMPCNFVHFILCQSSYFSVDYIIHIVKWVLFHFFNFARAVLLPIPGKIINSSACLHAFIFSVFIFVFLFMFGLFRRWM